MCYMDGEYCRYEYLDRMAPCVYRSRYWHWVPRAQRSGGWTPNWSTLRTSHWLSTVLDINVDIIYSGDIRVCTHGWREARAGLRRRTWRRGTAPTRWAPTSPRGTPWTLQCIIIYYLLCLLRTSISIIFHLCITHQTQSSGLSDSTVFPSSSAPVSSGCSPLRHSTKFWYLFSFIGAQSCTHIHI